MLPPPKDGLRFRLSSSEESELLTLARDSLVACTSGDTSETILDEFKNTLSTTKPHLLDNLACFVTLTQKSGRLRGCVGCLEGYQALYKNVFQFAQRAALEDPRFDPVTSDEVSGLTIEVSVLGPLKPLPDLEKLILGEQGLYVRYHNRHGVLLAQVATQYGWNHEEYALHTCEKAGIEPELRDECEFSYFDEICFSESKH